MEFLTDKKLVIAGAAGMIGSNMAQCAAMMRLTPNLCLYDTYAPGLEGVAEELYHCGFKGMNITWTTDVREAFAGARYMVSSGGAPRKAGMTREDLLRGNAGIAEQLGKDIRAYCPDLEHLVVIFNPADITGLVALLYSGLKPSQVTTLAALDSIIGTDRLPLEEWDKIRLRVVQGGKNIIDLRGRSSFQSPAYLSIEMIAAAMGGPSFTWPVGVYVDNDRFNHIMMAMETTLDRTGVHIHPVQGTPAEEGALEKSYRHLCDMRQEVIDLGILPPVDKWHDLNPNIK